MGFFLLFFTFDSLRKRTARSCLPCVEACVCVCVWWVLILYFSLHLGFRLNCLASPSTLYIHLHKQREQQQQRQAEVNALINDLETHHNEAGGTELKPCLLLLPLKLGEKKKRSILFCASTFTATLGRWQALSACCACACMGVCV